jgi:oxygen-independent coproporphyrinogen-3 oxidase
MIEEQRPGLYLHVPFCRSQCFYCDFYSVDSLSAIPAWLRAVRTEILLYEGRFHGFDSLYLGGGTPTILQDRDLAELIECLLGHLDFCPGSEMTMEANPESLSESKLRIARSLGVNRISLGIQSLDDTDLKYLGRIHDSTQALKAFETARSCGFENISVDLIYGLEVQDLPGWRKTLNRVLDLRPEHISCYQISFERGALFWKLKESGRVRPIG